MNMLNRTCATLSLALLAGCVGYGYPGQGYGTYPQSGYGRPGGYYPPSSGYGGVVRCESNDNRNHYCSVDTRGGVRLARQLSDSACIEGRTWGYDARGIWVTGGCRGEFVTGSGYGGGYGSGYGGAYGQLVRCESQDNRTQRCSAPVRRGVQLSRQLSGTRCIEGRNWGWDRGGIWVSGGCRGEFRVY